MLELPARPAASSAAPFPDAHPSGVSAAAMAAALDEIGQGLIILDVPAGRLRHANRQALTECACHGLLSLEDGAVRATDPADHRQLLQALQATLQGRRTLVSLRGGAPHRAEASEAMHRTRGTAPGAEASAPEAPARAPARGAVRPAALVVAVVPLQAQFGVPQAMVVFGRRQMADTLGVGYFARLHGLTPAEESVLLGLCRGHKPTEIASAHGVAISTIRTHVNAIRLKTGAGSIREIAQQVATLPPLAPALRDGLPGPR